jgi:hypothetical protein
MASVDFTVRNGLVVNNNLIYALGASGRIGINNTSPTANLHLTGTANVSGNVVFGANCRVNGGTYLVGNTQLGGNLLVVQTANVGGDINVTGVANVANDFSVTGAVTFANTLNVTGIVTFANQMSFSGNGNFTGNVNIVGAVTMANTLLVNGAVTFANQMNFSGNGSFSNTLLVTGATTLSNTLTVGGSTQIRSLGVGTAASGTVGEIRANNNITAYYTSDASFKENVKPIENALEKTMLVDGVEFDWTDEFIKEHGGEDGYFIRKHDVGVIAQNIEKVLPEVVATREDGTKAVKYDRIVALLIEAVKELKKEVDSLKG